MANRGITKKDFNSSLKVLLIDDPAKHRTVLLMAMERLLSGELDVPRANAMASLSSEVHKSMRQEWSMKEFTTPNLGISKKGVTVIDAEVVSEES